MSSRETEDRLKPVWTTEITTTKPAMSSTLPEKRLTKIILGLLFAATSGFSVTVSSVCRKYLSSLPPSQLVLHRYLGVMLFSLPIMVYNRQTPIKPWKLTTLLTFRGFCLGSGYILGFVSLNYIPLAEFSVLSGCTPVLATIMARIFLKEECGLIHVFCLILTMLGITLVSKLPLILTERTVPYGLSYYKGIAFTLLLAVMFAFGAVTTRIQNVKSLHYSVIMFFLGTGSVVECIMVSAVYGYSKLLCDSGNWIVLLLSVAGIGIDFSGTRALQYQPTAISVMVYSSCNIIGSYIWQITVEGIEPDVYTISGTIVMVVCLFLLTLRQTLAEKTNWKIFSIC